ncbi:MAG: ABC transporter substrate-binding protein [Rubrobacter sp.]
MGEGSGRVVRLRGMAFDHPRNFAPLKATAAAYGDEGTGVEVAWDARSLKDFEDYPVERLAERYDLFVMDHPFVGTGVQNGVLLPLDEFLPEGYLADQEQNSVGPSYRSYTWEGRQWALAVDAASQVSAYRPDLLDEAGGRVPATWDEVFALAESLSGGRKIGLSLNPTHSYCSFLTLCANLAGDGFWQEGSGVDAAVAGEALEILHRLARVAYEASLALDPIKVSELMARGDEIVYAPLLFGYATYARPDLVPQALRYAGIPSTGEPAGAVLGGVGLAVSALSAHREEAAGYAAYVAGETIQKGLYFDSGGQPGHRSAWVDDGINGRSNHFFRDTLATLDLAYLRPRYPGFPAFQRRAGACVHRFLLNGGSPRETVAELNRLYDESRTISREAR